MGPCPYLDPTRLCFLARKNMRYMRTAYPPESPRYIPCCRRSSQNLHSNGTNKRLGGGGTFGRYVVDIILFYVGHRSQVVTQPSAGDICHAIGPLLPQSQSSRHGTWRVFFRRHGGRRPPGTARGYVVRHLVAHADTASAPD